MGNYIYNGVELPPLPEWDKETYPYAVIWNNAGVGIYLQALPAKPLTTAKTVRDETIDYIEMETSGTYLTYWEDSNGWGYSGDATSEGAISIRTSLVLWANFDILNSDGTLYLAASDPIPVSTFTPDPISLTMGWIVGRRIAGQRGKKVEPTYTQVYDDEFPIEWNTLAVVGNPTIDDTFVKVSNLTPTAEEMATLTLRCTANGTVLTLSLMSSEDGEYVYREPSTSAIIALIVIPTSETYTDEETGEEKTVEAGLYATIIEGTSIDFALSAPSYALLWSNSIENILAEHEENENSTTNVTYNSHSIYNGVSLPCIPEDGDRFTDFTWDSTTYPYFVIVDGAVIYPTSSTYRYMLLRSTAPFTVNADNEFYTTGAGMSLYVKQAGEGEWISVDIYPSNNPASALIWSNHDIVDESGAVFLAATEPVFVSKEASSVFVKITDQVYSATELVGAKLVVEYGGEEMTLICAVQDYPDNGFTIASFTEGAMLLSDTSGLNGVLGGDGSPGLWFAMHADNNYTVTLYLQE